MAITLGMRVRTKDGQTGAVSEIHWDGKFDVKLDGNENSYQCFRTEDDWFPIGKADKPHRSNKKSTNGAARRTRMARNWHRYTAPLLKKRSEILVWGLMFSYAKVTSKSATVQMSVRTIARLLGWGRHATAQEAIEGLVAQGLLEVLEKGHKDNSGEPGIPSIYKLRVAAPPVPPQRNK